MERTNFMDSVPTFADDGNMSMVQFIKAFEDFADIGNWQDHTRISTAARKIREDADLLVQNDASFQNLQTWQAIKTALRAAFKPRMQLPEINSPLLASTQQPKVAVTKYNARFSKLINDFQAQQEPNAALRQQNANHFDLQKKLYFTNGLLPAVKQHVALAKPNTYQEALEKARELKPRSEQTPSKWYNHSKSKAE